MGYNPTPRIVTRYAETLEEIKATIDSKREIYFEPSPTQNLQSLSEQIANILRSARMFGDELDGRYQDLRDRTTVSVDWDKMRVVAKPKDSHTPKGRLNSRPPDERDALASLGSASSPANLEFKPSSNFNPDRFERQVNALGWTIDRAKEDEPGSSEEGWPAQRAGEWMVVAGTPEGWIGLIVKREHTRRDKSDKPSILEQFGFTQPDS